MHREDKADNMHHACKLKHMKITNDHVPYSSPRSFVWTTVHTTAIVSLPEERPLVLCDAVSVLCGAVIMMCGAMWCCPVAK
jgi:hypothetical protein